MELGPGLSDKVEKLVRNLAGKHQVLSPTADKMKAVLTPQGAEYLTPLKINEEIYSISNKSVKKENGELLKVEGAICKSSIVQARLIEKVLELKRLLPTTQGGLVNDIVKDISLSIEIQGFGRTKLNDLRRDNVAGALNPEYKSALTSASPGGLLFGANVDEALKQTETANKLLARLGDNKKTDYNKNRQQPFLAKRHYSAPRGPRGHHQNRFKRQYGRSNTNGYGSSRWSPSPDNYKRQDDNKKPR